jgi:glycosyltransferase involved in cell wall biosynthesis
MSAGGGGDGERVSVIIPSYNCAPYLAEAIDSVLGQTCPPHEVIVVDDGSTDGSLEIARGYGDAVVVVAQENAGVSAARNRGFDLATGDWLALLDADDLWSSDKLERQLSTVKGHSEVVCVFSDFYTLGSGSEPKIERQRDHPAAPDFRVQMLCNFVNTSTSLIRARSLGGLAFPVGVTAAEDMLFFAELRELGPFLQVSEPLAYYRLREGSAIHRSTHEVRSIDARYEFMMEHSDRYSEEEQLAVRRYLCDMLSMGDERALWQQRDPKLVRAYRRSFGQIRPSDLDVPQTFRRRLYPRWVYRLRDTLR